MGKVISVANQKGGVGKTTTVINLGTALGLFGKKVLLVDFDPQANTTSGLGFEPAKQKSTIYTVITEASEIRDSIQKTNFKNLYLIPSNMDLNGAKIELMNLEGREFVLKRYLSIVKNDFDYIFIDCPPSVGILTLNALVASDSVLIPIQSEYYALEGIAQLQKIIKMTKLSFNPNLHIEGVLVTMFDTRTNLSKQVLDNVKNFFGDLVYRSVIPRNVRVSESPSFGLPVINYSPSSPASKAYIELAREVIEKNEKESVGQRA